MSERTGYMESVTRIHCGRCTQKILVTPFIITEAAKHARREGWIESASLGWLCPACKAGVKDRLKR